MMNNKIVLIVDDEPDAIEFVKAVLGELENLEFIGVEDGNSGLLKAVSVIPDLIILDVMMPGMDGFAVFNELRKNDATKDIPVIMLTGVADKTGIKFFKDDMSNYYGSGPIDYIEKPLDPDRLLTSVNKLFNN